MYPLRDSVFVVLLEHPGKYNSSQENRGDWKGNGKGGERFLSDAPGTVRTGSK